MIAEAPGSRKTNRGVLFQRVIARRAAPKQSRRDRHVGLRPPRDTQAVFNSRLVSVWEMIQALAGLDVAEFAADDGFKVGGILQALGFLLQVLELLT